LPEIPDCSSEVFPRFPQRLGFQRYPSANDCHSASRESCAALNTYASPAHNRDYSRTTNDRDSTGRQSPVSSGRGIFKIFKCALNSYDFVVASLKRPGSCDKTIGFLDYISHQTSTTVNLGSLSIAKWLSDAGIH
jgi:hypothetical protein